MSLLNRAACFLALAAIPAVGNTETQPVVINAVSVTAAPKLDGALDDECWQALPEYTGFVDGDTRAAAKYQTTVKICYDSDYLYVAFHAQHPDPKHIKALETKRNGGGMRRDDFVAVNIDSLHTHNNESWFDVNSICTQSESLEKSSSSNIEYKGDWQAAAKIVDDGYNVEMAIPFSLLIYKDGQDTFGICFNRNLADDNVWTQWPDLNGIYDKHYYAHLTGLKPPKTILKPKILGYTMGITGDSTANGNAQGLDIKYPFSSSSVGVLSLEPDFRSVEQAVESVDFSYTERMLSDARPFFNEWAIPIDSRLFYSRRIQDFNTGLKFAVNNGSDSYGIMNMRAPGKQDDICASYTHNIGRSNLSFSIADHNTPGHRNTMAHYRGRFAWMQNQRSHYISAGRFNSVTTGLPDGAGTYMHYSTNGAVGDIGGFFDYSAVTEYCNSEIGYSNDNGTEGTGWGVWRDRTFRGGNLQSFWTGISVSNCDYINGAHYNSSRTIMSNVGFVDGKAIGAGYTSQQYKQFSEKLPYVEFDWNRYSLNRDGMAKISWGQRAGGNYLQHTLGQKFRMGQKLTLGLSWQREYISDPSPYAGTRRQTWVTMNYDLTSERSMGGRWVYEQGHNNLYFIYRQQMRHGTDAFVMFGDPNADSTSNRVTLKMVRAL